MMASTASSGDVKAGTPAKLDLGGIYPPIATPFDDNEEISYDKLKENLDIWNKIPFRGGCKHPVLDLSGV